MTIFGDKVLEFDGRIFGLRVSRGDYAIRFGALTIIKLNADWFVEGRDWSVRREPGGLVTVIQSEPRQRSVRGLDEPLEITGPTLH